MARGAVDGVLRRDAERQLADLQLRHEDLAATLKLTNHTKLYIRSQGLRLKKMLLAARSENENFRAELKSLRQQQRSTAAERCDQQTAFIELSGDHSQLKGSFERLLDALPKLLVAAAAADANDDRAAGGGSAGGEGGGDLLADVLTFLDLLEPAVVRLEAVTAAVAAEGGGDAADGLQTARRPQLGQEEAEEEKEDREGGPESSAPAAAGCSPLAQHATAAVQQ